MRYTSLACVSRKNMTDLIYECELHLKEIVCGLPLKLDAILYNPLIFLSSHLLYKSATNTQGVPRKMNILLQETRYIAVSSMTHTWMLHRISNHSDGAHPVF